MRSRLRSRVFEKSLALEIFRPTRAAAGERPRAVRRAMSDRLIVFPVGGDIDRKQLLVFHDSVHEG